MASEAASLAGHLGLSKLTCLYDDNAVTLAAGTAMTFSENRAARFEAYGWHTVLSVEDGNDLVAIEAALQAAREQTTRPSLILVRTHIGYGSPEQGHFQSPWLAPRRGRRAQDQGKTRLAHRNRTSWYPTPPWRTFAMPWNAGHAMKPTGVCAWTAYTQAFAELSQELQQRLSGELPSGWEADIPVFPTDAKGLATRDAGAKVMNAIAPRLPALSGGSADLDPSTKTVLKGLGDFTRRQCRAPINKAPTPAAGARSVATCTSVYASTRWAPSSTAWPPMAVSLPMARPSWSSPTTCARPCAWRH